ncbi:hypothetical protein H7S74_16895 [Priestia aryabhattai]|uniref:hypothetical protein n=1 Tax=Priestia TaxID=2800373 RepID=UPI001EBC15C8|nr:MULTISPECIES: hypothetical protein [Priestia]MBY0092599.1 hypothetical protein [Priestia aryabhattai]MBY0103042.1 hypothetical protein [Priestia aryabhattai]MCY9023613.1 hypothetical protein [Priestia megaterium]
MGRQGTKAKKISIANGLPSQFKRYVNYNMNPITLETDYFGEYIPSNLKEIKRKYDVLHTSVSGMRGNRKKLVQAIEKVEKTPRSRFSVLMKKTDKTIEEHEELYFRIIELEELHNELYLLDRRLRESSRILRAVYPPHVMELVYKELGLEMKGESINEAI